jgi:eukaryotic-like serine/threonine-protein kinase
MHAPDHLVAPRPSSTPARLSISHERRAIPEDLLRDASRRLGIMCLVAAVLWIIASILGHLSYHALHPEDPTWNRVGYPDRIALASAVLSVLLFAYTRRADRRPEFLLDLGLVYMVLMGLALGFISHWYPLGRTLPIQPMIGWGGVLVLIFSAIIPTPPLKMLVAGLLTVSMTPLAMLHARARGVWDFGPAINALLMHYPDYLLVGVGAVISHVVTKLGQQVSKAREMGSYQLGELLGRGGMGEVYKATHRMLARPAAIKLIRPEMLRARDTESAQVALRRFRREAEAAANLRSPHTVELYDFGVTEDETLYFVMELLDGLDLETLVRLHGPVPPDRAIHILRQVCESLAEAHARGMVHRDIKPANIHVGRLGLHHDFVKVLDFGLVKPVPAAAGSGNGNGGDPSSLATAAGLTPGTPAYMAPETSLGDTLDGRADLYALGCVAHYLLTGRLVFEAENAVRLIVMHLQDEPQPPSRHAPFPVPPELDALVLACLAKSPAERPASAAALDRALAAVPVAEPWSEERAAAWWRDHAPPASTGHASASPGLASGARPPSFPRTRESTAGA